MKYALADVMFFSSADRNVDIAACDIPVNAVATALKQFFMDLDAPLVPTHLYDELIDVAGACARARL